MVIQSLERKLSVISILDSSAETDIYICRDLFEEEDLNYLVLRVRDHELIKRQMPLLSGECKKSSFSDFRECFSKDGELYCVFRYSEGVTLYEKLETIPYSLKERLIIGRNLLTKVTDLDMHPDIQREALRFENILMDDGLGISFNYTLREVSEYGDNGTAVIASALGQVLRKLFEEAIETRLSKTITDFIERAESGAFESYIDLYKAYNEMYKTVLDDYEAGRLRPHSFLFALWYRICGLAKYAKPAIAVILVSAALAYLIWSFSGGGAGSGDSSAHKDFERIGTVDIKE